MYKKILISGVTAAAIVGAGGTAMALSGSNTTPGTDAALTSTTAPAHPGTATGRHDGKRRGKHAFGAALRRIEHGQFVTRAKDGTVTHDVIRGTVQAVSPTSITVTAADHTSQTYAVNSATKVRVRDNGKGSAGTITDVQPKDQVVVLGTGSSTFTAKHIVDLKGAHAHGTK